MIKAVIFDCFGVLITDALATVIAELRESQPEIAWRVSATIEASVKGQITRAESTATVASLLGTTRDEYVSRIKNGEVKNQQLLDYIAKLRPNYKTAMLSNISGGGLAVRFAPGELQKYFDVVIASGEIGYAKPEAQAYEITASKLGVKLNECIFIDDREEYCEGAKGVGMQAVLYRSFAQATQELSKLLLAD